MTVEIDPEFDRENAGMHSSEYTGSKPERFENLDGLRGLAAIAVAFSHLCATALLSLRGGGAVPGQTLLPLYASANEFVNFGRVGVVLFFLISGYLIPFSLTGSHVVRSFLISRFFRLYPLFWFSLALAAVLHLLMGEAPSAGQLLANITMIPDLVGSMRLLDVYWTLAIEFGFYACVVVLFLFLGPMRLPIAAGSAAVLLGATIAISVAQAFGTNLPLADKTYLLGAMFTGTALRVMRAGSLRHIRALIALMTAFSVAMWSRAYIHFDLQFYGPPNEFIGFRSALASDTLSMAVFLVGIRLSGSLSILVQLGRISYSLYILHPLVIMLSDWLDLSQRLAAMGLYVPLLMAVALGSSVLSYRWIEAPAIALGRTVRRRLEREPSDRSSVAPPEHAILRYDPLGRRESQLSSVR